MGEGIEFGSSIGHYRIVSKIGAGGMVEVYLAEDDDYHRSRPKPRKRLRMGER